MSVIKRYPSMGAITGSPESHTNALGIIKEKADVYERRTKDILSSFIRVADLVTLDILAVQSNRLILGSAFGASGGTPAPMNYLDDLLDVDALYPATGDVLTWDGTAWVNAVPTGGGGGSFSGVRVYNSSGQSLPGNANTILTFNSEKYDTDGYHSTSVNTSRITIPATGKYLVTAVAADTGVGPSSPRYLQLLKNGTEETRSTANQPNDPATVISVQDEYTAGDYLEVQLFHSDGATRATDAAKTFFAVVRLESVTRTEGPLSPDSYPTSPDVIDDEFDIGSTLDTAGTRFLGATGWAWINQNGATATLKNGILTLTQTTAANATSYNIIYMPTAGATWAYRAKFANRYGDGSSSNRFCNAGMFCGKSGGNFVAFSLHQDGGFTLTFLAQHCTSPTAVSSNAVGPAYNFSDFFNDDMQQSDFIYMEVKYDGTNVICGFSQTGAEGSYFQIATLNATTYWGGAPDQIGLCVNDSSAAGVLRLFADWFRKES